MFTYTMHTHLYNWSTSSYYSSTATFKECYSELMPYTALAYSIVLVSMMCINAKATPINDIDYNYHMTAVELCLTSYMGSLSCHTMPQVINSLGGGHTHIHIQTSAQKQFYDTRWAVACGWSVSGLKTSYVAS